MPDFLPAVHVIKPGQIQIEICPGRISEMPFLFLVGREIVSPFREYHRVYLCANA